MLALELARRLGSPELARSVLAVTLDKRGHGQEFQYGDRFLSPALFQWQVRTERLPTASTAGD